MARYSMYEIKMDGTTIDVGKQRGIYIVNGEKSYTDKYIKVPAKLRGYLVVDEELGWMTFIEVEKGDHMQWDAEVDWDFGNENYGSYDDRNMDWEVYDGYVRASSKGIEIARLYLDLEKISITTCFCGRWNESWKDVYIDGDYSDKKSSYRYSYYSFGTGVAEISGLPDIYIKTVKAKYNSRTSDMMWNAFYEAGGETNETAGVTAAEGVLNDFINKNAGTDDADYQLPEYID